MLDYKYESKTKHYSVPNNHLRHELYQWHKKMIGNNLLAEKKIVRAYSITS